MAQLLEKEEGLATDVKALAYLSNATMVAPMATEWVNTYLHLFTRWMGDKTPDDRRDEVSPWEQRKLKEIRGSYYVAGDLLVPLIGGDISDRAAMTRNLRPEWHRGG